MALQLKWWHGAIILFLVLLLLYVLLFFVNCFLLPPPSGAGRMPVGRDTLYQAFARPGELVTSGKLELRVPTKQFFACTDPGVTNQFRTDQIVGPEFGVPYTHVCTAVDSSLTGFDNRNGIVTYNGSTEATVRIVAYCNLDAAQLEQKVKELNIGINSISCPIDYPANSKETIGCMIGFTQG